MEHEDEDRRILKYNRKKASDIHYNTIFKSIYRLNRSITNCQLTGSQLSN